jgi:hypothetical protein
VENMKKAYLCEWLGIQSYVAAETNGKAKAVVNASIREVFSDYDAWNKIRARRAPQYDAWAAQARGTETVAPEYMPKEVQA